MKVKIQQFGKERIIHVNGKSCTIDELFAMCNVDRQAFDRNINSLMREQIICEWILKARAGVSSRCKIYWYKDIPMWVQTVVDKTGISPQGAMKRLKKWEKDGNMQFLMWPKYHQVVAPRIKPKRKKRSMAPPVPAVPAVPPDKPGDFSNWGTLSNKPRTHNLKKIQEPTEYDLKYN